VKRIAADSDELWSSTLWSSNREKPFLPNAGLLYFNSFGSCGGVLGSECLVSGIFSKDRIWSQAYQGDNPRDALALAGKRSPPANGASPGNKTTL
jgi:hypothetical protein